MSGSAGPVAPEDWERVKQIFHDALTVPQRERAGFVANACDGNPALQTQVASLLEAHDDATDFLETPAVALVGDVGAFRDSLPRDRVGPYKLLKEIGRGGMGTVYLATRDDGQFTQQVAVKLIKRGMDTDAIVARFRKERQIVAALQHPNIARLLDGGTSDDGLPYFVMEYVEGRTIRDHCAAKTLNIRERLQLFRVVCDAVQFAHQNLIVHRDIKASNIIVGDNGIPKLLDFGIAKVLRPVADAHLTLTATVGAMTPDYASPEQLRGESVTTATDVYSLGVLLYELLTGNRPFETASLSGDALVRAVCDTDPQAPSAMLRMSGAGPNVASVQRTLRGDLDTIVLMAIRKDPSRRYSSVERFSDDIGRYLDNQPVAAQRDTLAYRAGKFAKRNRVALSVGALVGVTLVVGVASTLWQARVAQQERLRAESRFAQIRSLATTFLFDVHDAVLPLAGSTPVREMLVKQGLASLAGLVKESQGDTLLERELSAAYQRLGSVQGNSYNGNLGDTKGAVESYRTSVQLLERSTDTTSGNSQALFALAAAHRGLGDILLNTGELKTAVGHLEHARSALTRAIALDSSNIEHHRALADLLFALGDSYGGVGLPNIGDTKQSLASYRKAIQTREWMLQRAPDDDEVSGGLANSLINLGSLALSLDDSTGTQHLARGVRILEALTAKSPENAARRNSLLSGYLRQRRPLADAGRYDDAMAADRKVLTVLEDMVKADPKNTLLQRNLGVTYNTLGADLVGAGRAAEAVTQHQKALAIAATLVANDPASLEMQQDLSYTRNALGDALREAGRYTDAVSEYGKGMDLKIRLRNAEPENPRHPADMVAVYSGRGLALVESNNMRAAQLDFDNAVHIADTLLVQSGATSRIRNSAALLYGRVGHMHVRQALQLSDRSAREQQCDEAMRWLNRSLEAWAKLKTNKELAGANRMKPDETRAEMGRCTSL